MDFVIRTVSISSSSSLPEKGNKCSPQQCRTLSSTVSGGGITPPPPSAQCLCDAMCTHLVKCRIARAQFPTENNCSFIVWRVTQPKQWEVKVEIMKYAKGSGSRWAFFMDWSPFPRLSPLCPYNCNCKSCASAVCVLSSKAEIIFTKPARRSFRLECWYLSQFTDMMYLERDHHQLLFLQAAMLKIDKKKLWKGVNWFASSWQG